MNEISASIITSAFMNRDKYSPKIENDIENRPSFAELVAQLAEVCKEECSTCTKDCPHKYGKKAKNT